MHILLNFGCVPLKRCKLATLRHTSFLYAPLRQNSSRKICKAVLPWRTLQAGDVSASRCFLGPGYQPKTLSVSRRAGYLRDSRIGLRLCGRQEKNGIKNRNRPKFRTFQKRKNILFMFVLLLANIIVSVLVIRISSAARAVAHLAHRVGLHSAVKVSL